MNEAVVLEQVCAVGLLPEVNLCFFSKTNQCGKDENDKPD